MFMTLSQYIQTLEALNVSGDKDRKIKDLLDYYHKYVEGIKPGAGTFYAVIYARYSSHSQREESIEGQIREDLEYAVRRNMIVLGVYIDEAISGKTDERTNFQTMIKDAERGNFQYVITWKVDRFARNRYDSATYKARLRRHNVQVVYARESIPDGPEGILLESVLEGQAEYYSASLSENIRRGQTDNAMECKVNGGARILGYRTGLDKHYEIDPATAPVVRRIFTLYHEGATLREIIDELNTSGFRTARGQPFGKSGLDKILRNERYIGIYKYRDTRIEGGMPAIIGEELFAAVQEQLDKNKKARARKKSEVEFLLTTKLYCGHCGMGMIGDSGTGGRKSTYYYYTCVGKKRDKTCNKKSVPKDWIEDLVINETIRLVASDEVVNEIADGVMNYIARERDDNSVLKGLQDQLKETQKAIENVIKAIEQGIITPSTKERLEALEADKTRIENGIMEESVAMPRITRDQVVFFLEQFRGGGAKNSEYRKRLVEVFVNAVYVYDDKIVITYNYSGEHNTATLEEIDAAIDGCGDICSGNGFGQRSLCSTKAG